jgi:single-strand DNA-binding protein
MSKGYNKALLLGTVGRDPEIRSTASGAVVASFSLATNDRTKVDGEWKDTVEWHNLVSFAKTAEIIRDYVRKGSQIFIEGKIQTRSWDNKDTGQKQYKTEILVNELTLLGGKESGGAKAESKPAAKKDPMSSTYITDDDIPTDIFGDDPF